MKVKRRLSGGMPKEYRYEFELGTYMAFRIPTILIAVLVLSFEAYMIIRVHMLPGPVTASLNRLTFFRCYTSLFGVTLIAVAAVLLGDKWFKRRPSDYLTICFLYSLFICVWGAFLSGYSHRSEADIYVFLYISLCVAILVPLRPSYAMVLYMVDWIVLYLAIKKYIGPEVDSFPSMVNSGFTTLLCIGIASTAHYNRVSNYISRRTILAQNQQIHEMNKRLSEIVLIDDLTQIYNRRYMELELPRILEQARERGLPVCLYMMDIDSFKEYNSLYGHQEGDVCLRRVADAIGEVLVTPGAYLLRYGGEEFLVLATGLDPDEAGGLGEAIRKNVEQQGIQHAKIPGGVVTVSVGACCSHGDDDTSLSQLIHYADTAMYAAKAKGKNRVERYSTQ